MTGNIYKASQTTTTANLNGQTPQFELTFVMSEVLISQGTSPNLVAHTTIHSLSTPTVFRMRML